MAELEQTTIAEEVQPQWQHDRVDFLAQKAAAEQKAAGSSKELYRDILRQNILEAIGRKDTEAAITLTALLKQEEDRLAAEQQQNFDNAAKLREEETALRKEAVALEDSRKAFGLAVTGAASGMTVGTGLLIFGAVAGSVGLMIPGVLIFGFGIAITHARARDAVIAYLNRKSEIKDDGNP